MSSAEQTEASPDAIRDQVRRTIQFLKELSQTEKDYDQFSNTVLERVVKMTGAHGALLWQVNGDGQPMLTHRSGVLPNETAKAILSQADGQHSKAVVDVVAKQRPIGLMSDAFTGRSTDQDQKGDDPFLMLLAPVFNRADSCCGTVELLQRANITSQAQEGYLRFLAQVSSLFQRWHEQRDLKKLTVNANSWSNRLEFISESHRSIDRKETCYAIANEARRLLNCDRVSVGTWNGRRCKIVAISSQDRFDNRSNVVRLLSNVATASVSANTPFWITGSTEGLAPEVANKINEYLDESHSRTLAVIPLLAQQPETAELEMKSRRRKKARKLGVVCLEYFDADVTEADIEEDRTLIVGQSEIALENARKHGEIFMLPIWKRLGWLQKLLFRDHLRKTLFGLACLGLLMAAMFFWPKELKMKVDGVMHPTVRRTIYPQTDGIITEVLIDEREKVTAGQKLMVLVNPDLEVGISVQEFEIKRVKADIAHATNQLSSGRVKDRLERSDLSMSVSHFEKKIADMQEQLELMKLKRSYQVIVSPIDGTVITPQPKRRYKDFPVVPNHALLEVVDLDGSWQLELKIPQAKVVYIDRAFIKADGDPLNVEFKIGTNPNLTLNGKIVNILPRAVPSETGPPEYRAIVDIDQDQLEELEEELRSGAGATAKILCGKRPLGFVCFYQVYDYLRTQIFF